MIRLPSTTLIARSARWFGLQAKRFSRKALEAEAEKALAEVRAGYGGHVFAAAEEVAGLVRTG